MADYMLRCHISPLIITITLYVGLVSDSWRLLIAITPTYTHKKRRRPPLRYIYVTSLPLRHDYQYEEIDVFAITPRPYVYTSVVGH